MKRSLQAVFILVMMICSCNDSDEKFTIVLKEENPYVLNIQDFNFQKVNGSNDVVGDFDKLNHAIGAKLKGRTGVCEIYLNAINLNEPYLGFLFLTKDRDWNTFYNRGGIRAMLQRKLSYGQPLPSDSSVVVDSANLHLRDTLAYSKP